MAHQGVPGQSITELAARRDALRQAAGIAGASARELLDAALTELDGAIDALGAYSGGREPGSGMAGGPGAAAAPGGSAEAGAGRAGGADDAVRAERRLLQATFQRAPVPLFLLEQDGTIRRANVKAAELVGAPAGYATGRPLTVFLDVPSRAAARVQLAAVARDGRLRQVPCRVLTPNGPASATLTADVITLPGDPPLLVVMITAGEAGAPRVPRRGGGSQGGRAGGDGVPGGRVCGDEASDRALRAMTKRMDLVSAVTRVLLDNATFSEAVTLQRCARLLAGELSSWVLVDIERGGRLRRQLAIGPRPGDGRPGDRQPGRPWAGDPARLVRESDPGPDSAPARVHETRKPVLLAHADDADVLGAAADGTPLLTALGISSVICVPIADEGASGNTASYGALTLARLAGEPLFSLAELGLAEEVGGHLALAMRVDRMFRRRSEAAEALQASLLPARIPDIPGLELAAAYLTATQSPEISGDFYDVFRAGDAWVVAVGDVCGKGQEAAAVTAAARHAIRAIAHHGADDGLVDPASVLAQVNALLLAADPVAGDGPADARDERFVTAVLASLRPRDGGWLVRIGGCGHPGPVVVRADGRVEVLDAGGLPLGLFADSAPGSRELELGNGDLLVFYTDGVTGASGAAGPGAFEDRLADELAAVAGGSAAETVRAVQELVTSLPGGELRDDVTVLAVKACHPD